VDDEVLAVGEEAARVGNPGEQTALNRIRQRVVFRRDLLVEGDERLRELVADAGTEELFGQALRRVRSVRRPDVDRQVREPRIDVDGHVRPQEVILRLRHRARHVVEIDFRPAFERRRSHRSGLAREIAMRLQGIDVGPHVDRGVEARMGDGAVIAFEIVLEHRLPVGA